MFFNMFRPRGFMNKIAKQAAVAPHNFLANDKLSVLVNAEMENDSFFHPNLGGITRGGMSNHYPMTIMSLAGLGANDDEINHFRQLWPRYRSHISKDLGLVDKHDLTLDNWANYLGQASRLLEFQRVFLQGLSEFGTDKLYYSLALDKMKFSLPMGLYHPLIQLSFAVMHGDKKLIANALAYFAIRYQNLYRQYPSLSQKGSTNITAQAVWAAARANISTINIGFQPRGGSLSICEQLCGEKAIQDNAFANGFTINENNLTIKIVQISQLAIRLYLAEPALTTLHAVTSCQALADLTLRFVSDKAHTDYLCETLVVILDLADRPLSRKRLCRVFTLLLIRATAIKTNWPSIAQKARNIPEVHLIKMVYSCKWLFEHIEANELYRIVCYEYCQ